MTELSKNTSQSAETIVQYVGELRGSIDELISLVSSTTAHLGEGNAMMQQSVEDFNTMTEQMGFINESINNIYSSVNTQTEATNQFANSMENIVESYASLGDDCMNTGKHMHVINRYIDTTRSDMARGFSNLTTQDWLRVFQIDHLIFTWRVYSNLVHFEHLKITQLNNPKGCKLGKWAGSQTDPKITGNKEFKDVLKYHDELHQHACDSWYAAEDDNTELAMDGFNKTLESYKKFSAAMDDFKRYMRSLGYTDETKIKVFNP